MTPQLRNRSRRASGEDGVIFVEFALILPILLAALFGIISAAIAWNHNLAMTHATRVTTRYGSTLPNDALLVADVPGWNTWLDSVATVATANDEGTFTTNGDATLCVSYVFEDPTVAANANDHAHRRFQVAGNAPVYTHAVGPGAMTAAGCFNDGLTTAGRVQSELTREDKLNYFIAKQSVSLESRGVTPHAGT